MRQLLIISLLLVNSGIAVLAEEKVVVGEVTAAQLQNVLNLLNSPDAARRAAAYKACRDRGDEFKGMYADVLELSWKHHAQQMGKLIEGQFGPRTAAGRLTESYLEWEAAAEAARNHIQKDHKKAKKELDEIDRLFVVAERAWRNVSRVGRGLVGEDPVVVRLESAATALYEIRREREWCEGGSVGLDGTGVEPDILEMVGMVVGGDEAGRGRQVRDYLMARSTLSRFLVALEDAHKKNDAMRWAAADLRSFAKILNDRRAIVGLQPLILNEKLSLACSLHSAEMVKLGYFSHTSPVKENETPVMRAQNSGFSGFAGECIFMGSADPAAAERAWWYSCGHRQINYSGAPEILGIGRQGVHWTLNTGRVRN